MSTGVAASPSKNWKELYRAALYETDKNRVSERIANAEWALALRARELFHTGRESARTASRGRSDLCPTGSPSHDDR